MNLCQMLDLAISEHKKEFQGQLPKKFQLHYCVLRMLVEELAEFKILPIEQNKYKGVELELNSKFKYPKIVTVDNDIRFL